MAADGFPAGHESPEGAASDLARSFINRDDKLFVVTSLRPYGGGQARAEYEGFLREIVRRLKEAATKPAAPPDAPGKIAKVFAARRLTLTGPASFGYAAFGFQDVMFVDVETYLNNGFRSMVRTLVVKDGDGKWYAHPDPFVSPLLSEGLNEESQSSLSFADAYALEK